MISANADRELFSFSIVNFFLSPTTNNQASAIFPPPLFVFCSEVAFHFIYLFIFSVLVGVL